MKHPLSKAKNKKCAAPAAKILLCKNRNKFGKIRLDDEGVDVGGDDSDGGRGRLVGDEFDFRGDASVESAHLAEVQQLGLDNDIFFPPSELLDEEDYGGGDRPQVIRDIGGPEGLGGGGRPLLVNDIGGPEGLGGAPGPEYGDYSQSRVGRRKKYKPPRRDYYTGSHRRRPARNRVGADPQLYSYYSYDSVVHYPITPITTTYENTYEYNLHFRNGRGKRPNKKLQRRGSRGPRRGSRHHYPQNYHRLNPGYREGHLGRASSEAEKVSDPQYSFVSYDTYVQYPLIVPPPLTTTTYESTYEYNLRFRNGQHGQRKRPNKKLKRQGAQGPIHGSKYKKYPHAYSRASSEVDKVSDPQDFFLTYDTFEVLPAGYQGYYHPFEYIEFFNGRAAPARKKRSKASKLLKNKKNGHRLAADAVSKPQFFDLYDDYIPQLPYRRKPYYNPYGYDRSGKPRRRRNRAAKRPSKKTAARASDEDDEAGDHQFSSLTYDSSLELPYSPLPYNYPHRYYDYYRSRPGKKNGLRAPKRAIRSELGSSEPEEKRKLRHASSEETEDDDQRARIAGDESSAAAADGELRKARADINSGSLEVGPRARAGTGDDEAEEEESNRRKSRKRRGKNRDKSKRKRRNKNKEREADHETEAAADPVTFGQSGEFAAEVRTSDSSFEVKKQANLVHL